MKKNKYYCNPLNINYRYQFIQNPMSKDVDINREAADPSMILFQGKYYIFASRTLSVQVSEDLVHWESIMLPKDLPLYGYAPDARVCGEYVYFCANESEVVCHFYRTKDILKGPYEKIEGSFSFSDPNLFVDEDGRMYFYWGLSCKKPIYGVELNSLTMRQIGEPKELIFADPFVKGFERVGEDHTTLPCTDEELEIRYQKALESRGVTNPEQVPADMQELMKDMLRNAPFIEGAWMSKLNGRYYLQYAAPSTQFHTYADIVYTSDHPLGPFTMAKANPYSYKPGGFMPGAGHGSTMEDLHGNLWHASTMRISVNHQFERRIGVWQAGLDADGELFCNQRYGDWPIAVEQAKLNPWVEPEWYLLSQGKKVTASSYTAGNEPAWAAEENVRTWWQAANIQSDEWLEMDLQRTYDVHAVQINFADIKEAILAAAPELQKEKLAEGSNHYIEESQLRTRWILEGSRDGETYFNLEDYSAVETDLAHPLVVFEDGINARFVRLTILEVPFGQNACISGLRVFGRGEGEKPEAPEYRAVRTTDLDMEVNIEESVEQTEAEGRPLGYNILWGYAPEKLYHSYMIFENKKRIGALVKNQEYYVRVDAFNESGITTGTLQRVTAKAEN